MPNGKIFGSHCSDALCLFFFCLKIIRKKMDEQKTLVLFSDYNKCINREFQINKISPGAGENRGSIEVSF